jgi:hypothetical protein
MQDGQDGADLTLTKDMADRLACLENGSIGKNLADGVERHAFHSGSGF